MDATTSRTNAAIPRWQRRLGRGRWVSIRPIERTDAPGLSDFYAGLSRETLHRRFLGSPPIDDDELGARFASRSGLVAVLAERGPNDGAIVGHACIEADGGGAAEVAFVVADAFQRRGVGRQLVRGAVALAGSMGLVRLTASLFLGNVAMRQLLCHAGCGVVRDEIDAGVEELTLALPASRGRPRLRAGRTAHRTAAYPR